VVITEKSPRRITRSSKRTADRTDSVFLAPAMMIDATSSMAKGFRTRVKFDDGESVAPFASRSSFASTASQGKKRRIMCTTPDVSKERALEVKTSSAVDISAEFLRHVAEIMRVATSSSNLKGTFIKTLKDAASYITAAWMYKTKKSETTHNSGAVAMRIVEARLSTLEENAALRRELARRTVSARVCPRCSGSASESGRPPRKDKSDRDRIDALQRKFEEFGPWIIRAMGECFGGRRPRSPEPQRRVDHSATRQVTQVSGLPREQEGDEWRVVESKKRSRKKKG
jgi:hypothetical protein